ncbi:AfsR/SARP family transcriptional regulator [Streptomyces geranii]|uniref:AfsR/SARP family transcriptional regulator n=1 Tax=Streptomyces geranii TaxID=2058923 RepID=UPI0013008B3D|nr:tetratricopeptide repeat protein [Streptomyces geranii]
MRFSVLGPVRVWRDSGEVRLGAAQQRLLLALLMAHAGQPVTMEETVRALWGESPPGRPANAVYRHIGVLRRLLEPELAMRATGGWLVRDIGGYRLNASPDSLDLLRFRELVRRARTARGSGGMGGTGGDSGGSATAAVPLFLEALALRTGAVATGIPAEARSHPAIEALEREYLTVVKEAADVPMTPAAAGQLLAVLHRTAADHPLDEPLQARLVRTLAATGQRAEALDTWHRVRLLLDAELGVAPGAELRAAQRDVLRQDEPVATRLAAGPTRTNSTSSANGNSPNRTNGTSGTNSTGSKGSPGVARLNGTTRTGGSDGANGKSRSIRPLRTERPKTVPAGRLAVVPALEDAQARHGRDTAGTGGAGPFVRAVPDPFVRPAQLPADLVTFAGRRAELAQVTGLSADPAPGLRIAAISGMGGIGKTTLAVRWAHRIAHRFPDGQLYVNLRGFDPGGAATDPGQALRGFLEALGVPGQRIPAGANAQTGLYRTLLARRRVLILLDNARDAEQVRPLLPGSPGCLVVVTSRDRLLGLVTAEAARPLALDRLPAAEARESLARRLGADRLLADPAAVDEIVARCAGLPLALAVVATRAAANPDFPLTAVADELRTAHGSLDAFTDTDPAGDVRAVFSWSYRALSPGAARLLRLLSLHPGPDVTVSAAAAVADVEPDAARLLLAELTRSHLLTEHAPGRYNCHDLLRTYAMERAGRDETTEAREAAVHRLLDHYLHTAHAAGLLYSPLWRTSPLTAATAGARPEALADDKRALRWYTAERQVLPAVAGLAAEQGYDGHVWSLAWTLERFMDRQGHWHESVALHRAGLDAAVRDGDRVAQAHLLRGLARASARLERYDDARTHIGRSLALCAELGDLPGLAHAHRSHAWLLDRLADYDGALDAAGRALALYRTIGDHGAATSAQHALGWTHVLRGDHRQATVHLEEALAGLDGLYGTRYGKAGTWDSLGIARHHLGEHQRAIAAFQCALRLYREVGDTYSEAGTLRHLGDTYLAVGDPGSARTVWEHALRLLTPADPTAASELRTRLQALGDAVPAPRISAVTASP